jgi:hypothetical protein
MDEECNGLTLPEFLVRNLRFFNQTYRCSISVCGKTADNRDGAQEPTGEVHGTPRLLVDSDPSSWNVDAEMSGLWPLYQ